MSEISDAEEQLVRIQRMHEAIQASGVVGRSPDGGVRVQVSPGGLLEGLELSPRVVALGPTAVSRMIMDTLRSALVELEQNLTETVVDAQAGEVGTQTLAELRRGLAGPLASLRADDDTSSS
ncbi:hypothetical protein ET475_03940 [Microbacterium protaetiae]|uniref:YbaB/EbfC family DNA-binding protein n=1 Tax=Microbacterium protaetiae TaxID=2509458 RepID=A0A4P6EC87_9MICO|nr:YbaB/EbfC family nucleoid-associated protein [Microbacterium protaetiae]QAY59226.1 hypothetical protein ET475_03940 [Microbacterium protaetiae]